MNTSRQSDTNSDARYGPAVGSYNVNMGPSGSNYYTSGMAPQPQMAMDINYGANDYASGRSGYGYGYDYGLGFDGRPYTTMTTEPVTIKHNQPLVIVDPLIEPHVKSYLTWSIFNIFCCCLFGGLVTTFMSLNVMRLNDSQNFKAATKLSGKVLWANMIISGLGALIILIVFPYVYMAIYPYLPKINW
jgi:hypothetical protein